MDNFVFDENANICNECSIHSCLSGDVQTIILKAGSTASSPYIPSVNIINLSVKSTYSCRADISCGPSAAPTAAPTIGVRRICFWFFCIDICFPSNAIVKERTRGYIKMQQLEYGDWVEAVDFSGHVVFKEVFLFGHKDANPNMLFEFFNFAVGSKTLTLSSTHYTRLCIAHCNAEGIQNHSYQLINVYARDVKVGDIMLIVHHHQGGPDTIIDGTTTNVSFQKVDMVWISTDSGLHNPYILGADIIVNGVVASVHAVHYVSNYHSPLLHTVYAVYRIVGPKNMHLLVEGLRIHEYTGSLHRHYIAAFLVQLLPVLPLLLYCLTSSSKKAFKKRVSE